MHLSHEILYVLVAFLGGSLFGMVMGIGLLVAWLKGWIFPVSIPEHLVRNAGLPGE